MSPSCFVFNDTNISSDGWETKKVREGEKGGVSSSLCHFPPSLQFSYFSPILHFSQTICYYSPIFTHFLTSLSLLYWMGCSLGDRQRKLRPALPSLSSTPFLSWLGHSLGDRERKSRLLIPFLISEIISILCVNFSSFFNHLFQVDKGIKFSFLHFNYFSSSPQFISFLSILILSPGDKQWYLYDLFYSILFR